MSDEVKTVKLGGEELRCIDTMPLGYLFDLAEAMDADDMMKAVAGMAKTIRTLVVKEDQQRLNEILHRLENPVGFPELNEALGTAMTQYTKRPLGKPSPSSPGPAVRGGTSKVVSLSRATVKVEEESQTDGASQAS